VGLIPAGQADDRLQRSLCAAFVVQMNEHGSVSVRQKWLHNFRQCDEWNLCLTAGTVVPANQELR
jgi:hypothetical protein